MLKAVWYGNITFENTSPCKVEKLKGTALFSNEFQVAAVQGTAGN